MLELHLEPGRTARLDGSELENGRPIRLTERSEVVLHGVGRLVIVPGGGEMAGYRSALRAAIAHRDQALAALRVDDLAAAERRAEERRAGEAVIGGFEARRDAQLAALDLASIEALEDRVVAVRAACAALGDGGDDEGDLACRLEEAKAVLGRAVARLEAARAATRVRDRRLTEVRHGRALIEQQEAAAQDAIGRASARLTDLASVRSEQALADDLVAAGERRLELLGERENLLRERARVDPELTRERRDQAERALVATERERERLESDILTVQSMLQAVGDEGRGERLAEVELRHAHASSELERVFLKARAWRLVHEELTQAATAAREAYLTPVIDRLRPWLVRLWPDAEPVLDPTSLVPVRLRRGGEEEPLGALSIGTREQLAVLVRLGLAQLLLEREGEAPCLVLDDALVYADETRFETMKLILRRAARELQIIILTCRPRDYAGLAERSFRLEDCRLPA